jgi:hypothetical protein
LIEMAAKSLDAGHDPNAYDAISIGTNAIIAELDTADEAIARVVRHLQRRDDKRPGSPGLFRVTLASFLRGRLQRAQFPFRY